MKKEIAYRDLSKFETAPFDAFPAGNLDRNVKLIETRSHSSGHEDFRNDDQQELESLFAWKPWPELVGYRLATMDPISIRILMSVSAIHYYLPAFFLTSLYLRNEPLAMIGEVDELLLPPDHEQIRSAFSGYGVMTPEWDSLYILRFNEFFCALNNKQRKVCADFLRIWYPLHRERIFAASPMDFKLLLEFWET